MRRRLRKTLQLLVCDSQHSFGLTLTTFLIACGARKKRTRRVMTSSTDDGILLDVLGSNNLLEDVNRTVVPIAASTAISSHAVRTRDADHFFNPPVKSADGKETRQCREWYCLVHFS